MTPHRARDAALILAMLVVCSTGRTSGIAARLSVSVESLAAIDGIVQGQIANARIPGAVILIGEGDAILYRRAFGWRAAKPVRLPMAIDTLFDLASLTKVVATTTAVMQLAEREKVDLDAPASTYWPRFAAHDKGAITVRALLTHYSGLKPDLDLRHRWSGYSTAMRLLVQETPLSPPRTRYVYSDENFAVLGEVVRRVSGLPLDVYCEWNIFRPLGMTRTRFRPSDGAADVPIAPTGSRVSASGIAVVHDPTAARMGGVAGHAGLYSTADDLARFARMLLHGGELDGVTVLRPESITTMIASQSPVAGGRQRALGWDVVPPFASHTDEQLPEGSFGHTGYTGTMIWIDPASRVYAIVLTNRTYPNGRGDAQPLRDAILTLVANALTAAKVQDSPRTR